MGHKFKNLMDKILDINNVYLSYKQSSSSRHERKDFAWFEINLEENLNYIRNLVSSGIYQVGDYTYFTVYEPKERIIMKLPVKDRIVQHMWDNVVNPIFDNRFYYHSYACRLGKGLHAASSVLSSWLYNLTTIQGKKIYALKGDIFNYFMNIRHDILLDQFCRYIGDKQVINLTEKFIRSNGNMRNGVGIPVGNLSSQLFANIYGNILDEFVHIKNKFKYYIRYMDDFIILYDDYHVLDEFMYILQEFLLDNMMCVLNDSSTIFYSGDGIPFVGFKHFNDYVTPTQESYSRFIKFANKNVINDKDLHKYIDSYNCRVAHLYNTDLYNTIQIYDELNIVKLPYYMIEKYFMKDPESIVINSVNIDDLRLQNKNNRDMIVKINYDI